MRLNTYLLPFMLVALFCGVVGAAIDPQDPSEVAWPDVDSLPAGKTSNLSLPFWAGVFSVDDQRLPVAVYLPKDYDPEGDRVYPLIVNHPGGGGMPGTGLGQQLAGPDDAIVIGTGHMMKTTGLRPRMQHYLPYALTVQWALRTFPIDHTRITMGGFSAGGWACTRLFMYRPLRGVPTHWYIYGAGVDSNNSPWIEGFSGTHVMFACGTKDFNYRPMQGGAEYLRKQGFHVASFEDPGVEHAVSTDMKAFAADWWQEFSPHAHGEEWLAAARAADPGDEDPVHLTRLMALPADHEVGAAVRTLLAEREGAAAELYATARAHWRRGDWARAEQAFQEAGRAGQRVGAARITHGATWYLQRLPDFRAGDLMIEALSAWSQGRVAEGLVLAGHAGKYAARSRGWDKRDAVEEVADNMKEILSGGLAAQQDRDAVAAQRELVDIRLDIMRGRHTRARSWDKLSQALDELVAERPDSSEAAAAQRLRHRLGERPVDD